MKLLIAPLAALAETKGPFGRARALAEAALARGHTVAFCAAEDFNYRAVPGVANYPAPCPSPFGTPLAVGKRVFRVAQALGLQQRRPVHSFEEVLHIMGATAPRFFPRDVDAVRQAIRAFQPDVLYSEFRPAALVAARLEGLPAVTGYSYPVQHAYRSDPQHSVGVRDFLRANHLPPVESALELFDWAAMKFVPSSPDLEPIPGGNVYHVGPFTSLKRRTSGGPRDKIVAYMGNGTISAGRLRSVLQEAFGGSRFQVYLASAGLKPGDFGNLHVSERFPFSDLLPCAAVFINHGGQNSIMDGLVNGVPQLIVPGLVFERQYNAQSIDNLGAGRVMSEREFTPETVRAAAAELESDPAVSQSATLAGERLLTLGGAPRVVEILEQTYS